HLPGAERDGERASDAAEQASAGAAAALPEFRLQQLSIRKHPDLDRVIVQVIDSRTGEVIRQIPPEEWVQVLESMHAAKGVLVDREG
ncbi:MAG: flagellar protein FlaG, partial [Thermodesulfobacteriota bacterium]